MADENESVRVRPYVPTSEEMETMRQAQELKNRTGIAVSELARLGPERISHYFNQSAKPADKAVVGFGIALFMLGAALFLRDPGHMAAPGAVWAVSMGCAAFAGRTRGINIRVANDIKTELERTGGLPSQKPR